MKKTISVVLVLVLLFSMGMQVTALPYNDFLGIDEAEYDMDAYYAALWDNYNHNMHGLLWDYVCGEEYYVYTQTVNKVGNDGWIQFASQLTEEELTRERYTEILVNLMAMMDYNVSDLIEEQVSSDSLKTFSDYTVDVAGILVQTISLNTAFGAKITNPMKKITTALNLTWGGAEFTISTIETFEYLDRLLLQYENHSMFLSAIEENATDSELREAAKDLRSLADMTFYYKVNAVTEVSGDLALYLGRTVFFETLVLDYMVSDASVLGLSEADMSAIELLKTAYTYLGTLPLAADLGVFAADMLIGISNVLNRYNEMRALVEIRKAVIIKLTELRNDIVTATELVKIDSLCKLMKNLVYINYRGEYCAHEMLASDAQAYSLVIKINGQVRAINEVFENAKENTRTFVECLNIFVFPMVELYKTSTLDNPIPPTDDTSKKKLTQIICFDRNGEYSNEHNFKYNDRGLISGYDDMVCTYNENDQLLWVVGGEPVDAYAPGSNWGSGFEYDENGRVIKEFFWEGGYYDIVHTYDETGKLVSSVSSAEDGSYEYRYEYNEAGLRDCEYGRGLDEDNQADTWMSSYDYSYKPFVMINFDDGSSTTSIKLCADDYLPIFEQWFYEPIKVTVDEDGYLSQLQTDSGRRYEFYYDGETSALLPQEEKPAEDIQEPDVPDDKKTSVSDEVLEEMAAYFGTYETIAFVDPETNLSGSLGLMIEEIDDNVGVWFFCWMDGVSSSVEDFYFDYQYGEAQYKVVGNRNRSEYQFTFTFMETGIDVEVSRIMDRYAIIPEGVYHFQQ